MRECEPELGCLKCMYFGECCYCGKRWQLYVSQRTEVAMMATEVSTMIGGLLCDTLLMRRGVHELWMKVSQLSRTFRETLGGVLTFSCTGGTLETCFS